GTQAKNFLQNGVGPLASQKIRPRVAAIRPNTTMSLVIRAVDVSAVSGAMYSSVACGAAGPRKAESRLAPAFRLVHWPMCFFSQALTVSCQSTLLAGLSTQWFSSGK